MCLQHLLPLPLSGQRFDQRVQLLLMLCGLRRQLAALGGELLQCGLLLGALLRGGIAGLSPLGLRRLQLGDLMVERGDTVIDQLLLLPHMLGMGLLRQTGLFHRLLQRRQLRRVLLLLLRQLGCLLLYRLQLGAAAIAFAAQRRNSRPVRSAPAAAAAGGLGLLAQGGFQPPLPLVLLLLEALPLLQPAQRLLLLLGLLAESAFLRAQRRQPFRQGVALFIVQQLDAAGALVQRIRQFWPACGIRTPVRTAARRFRCRSALPTARRDRWRRR